MALSYVCGMILLHTGLGIIFAYAGILAGSSLQSPWVNVLLALLMFGMALSLLGVFNWTLPAHVTRILTQIGAKRGHKSAFLMGLAAGIIAIPCTGPILAGILTMIAGKQNLAQGTSMMFSYALGMGLPFLVLGTFSSSVSKLPKSGPWMNRVKMVLSIFMIWLSFHYGVLAYNGFQKQMASQTYETQIRTAKAQNKRVILDFWADWCTLCHDLDEKTFKDPKVIEALKKYVVIKVDVTVDSKETKLLQEVYGVVGLPTIVFIDSGKKISGFIQAKDFVKILASPRP